MATGTTGACALIAMMNPPFLNGSSSPVRLRVPSGKDQERVARPAARSAAPFDGRQALLGIAALERNEAGQVEGLDQHRQLAQFGFVEDPQPRKQLVQRVEDDRRLDVARVVDGVNRGAVALDVFARPRPCR